ncbi:MAG: cobalamin-binding protein [Vicinamibacterales bacterium]
MSRYPERIVCLTEETTETLYLLGQGARVVGVSGYTVRPPEARSKPRISAFISARFDRIVSLEPDLVLAFSDLQADLAAELTRRGIAVVTFNQRSIAEILQMIRMLGGLVGCQHEAEQLADTLERGLDEIREAASRFPRRLRAFFEEWDEPLISGIRWVEELMAIAGADPIFPELATARLARDRIVNPREVARRDPEIIFASWCGKRVRPATITAREGWSTVSAVRSGRIHEIKSTLILQPGPASLTDGVRQLHAVLAAIHA